MSSADPIPIHPAQRTHPAKPAFVLRLNEDSLAALRQFVLSGGRDGIEIDIGENDSTLYLPSAPPVALIPTPLPTPLDIISTDASTFPSAYSYHSHASTRFAVRQTHVSAAAKNKLRAQNEQAEKDKKERGIVKLDQAPGNLKLTKTGKKTIGSSSKGSLLVIGKERRGPSPGSAPSSASSSFDARGRPGMTAGTMGRTGSSEGRPDAIPLETRVLHLLALGHLGFREIQAKVKGPEEQLRQVLNSVAAYSGATSMYRLAHTSYAQLDIHGWPQYSHSDRNRLIADATAAYDFLRLPSDAPERANLVPKPKIVPSSLRREASPMPAVKEGASPADSTGGASTSGSASGGGRERGEGAEVKPRNDKEADRDADRRRTLSNQSRAEAVASPNGTKRKEREGEGEASRHDLMSTSTSKRPKVDDGGGSITSSQSRPKPKPKTTSISIKRSVTTQDMSGNAKSVETATPPMSKSISTSGIAPSPLGTAPSTPNLPIEFPPKSSNINGHTSHPTTVSSQPTTNGKRKRGPHPPSPTFTSSSEGEGGESPPRGQRPPQRSSTSPPPQSVPDSAPTSNSSSNHQTSSKLPAKPARRPSLSPQRNASHSQSTSRSRTRSLSPLPFSSLAHLPASPISLRKRFKALWPEYETLTNRLEKERIDSERILAGEETHERDGGGGDKKRSKDKDRDGKEGKKGRKLSDVERDVQRRRQLHGELEEIKKRLMDSAAAVGARGDGKRRR